MGRPKEFDREEALDEAIKVFASAGFEGTSTDDLLGRMGISRQSLYDTFGDKRRLYLQALERYTRRSTEELIEALRSHDSPLKGIEAVLMTLAMRPFAKPEDGCLGVGAVCEFGRADAEVNAAGDASASALHAALRQAVRKGQEAGEIDASLTPTMVSQFIAATLAGMKVSARGGATHDALRNVARMAVRSLKPE